MILEVGCVLALLYIVWYISANYRSKDEPPIISGYIPYLGMGVEFGKNGPKLLTDCQKKYGDVFTLYIAGKRMTFVLNPANIPTFMSNRHNLKFSVIANQIGYDAFGYDTRHLSEDHYLHKDIHRSYIQNLSGNKHLNDLVTTMQKQLSIQMQKLVPKTQNEQRNLYHFIYEILFGPALHTVFGGPLDTPYIKKNFRIFDEKFPLLAAGIPSWLFKEQVKACTNLKNVFTNQIERKNTQSEIVKSREDIFTKAVQDKSIIPDCKLRQQAALVWALQANTVPAAFWSAHNILRDENVSEIMKNELKRVIRNTEGNSEWEFGDNLPELNKQDLDKLIKLESAIMESLRLSTSSLSIRKVVKAVSLTLSGKKYTFRKGDQVLFPPVVHHHDPELYPNPYVFVWDRYLDNHHDDDKRSNNNSPPKLKSHFQTKGGKRIPRSQAYMPFGGGVSMCPGRFFAVNEVKLVVVYILSHYSSAKVTGTVPELDQNRMGLGILPPKNDGEGCVVSLSKF